MNVFAKFYVAMLEFRVTASLCLSFFTDDFVKNMTVKLIIFNEWVDFLQKFLKIIKYSHPCNVIIKSVDSGNIELIIN